MAYPRERETCASVTLLTCRKDSFPPGLAGICQFLTCSEDSFRRGRASVRGWARSGHLMGFEEDRSANLVCARFVPSAMLATSPDPSSRRRLAVWIFMTRRRGQPLALLKGRFFSTARRIAASTI